MPRVGVINLTEMMLHLCFIPSPRNLMGHLGHSGRSGEDSGPLKSRGIKEGPKRRRGYFRGVYLVTLSPNSSFVSLETISKYDEL